MAKKKDIDYNLKEYENHRIGNPSPEYLVVFPYLRKDGLPCGDTTRELIEEQLTAVLPENIQYVSMVLEHYPEESKIPVGILREYAAHFMRYLNTIQPKVIITFGTKIPKTLLKWDSHESLDSNHGSHYPLVLDNYSTTLIPLHGANYWSRAYYKKLRDNDLKVRCNVELVDATPPAWAQVTEGEFLTLLKRAKPKQVVLDIESTGLNPITDTILMIGFILDTNYETKIVVKPSRGFLDAFLSFVIANDVEMIGHNIKFDLRFLLMNGIAEEGLPLMSAYRNLAAKLPSFSDTIVLAHLRSAIIKNLKHLATTILNRLGNNVYKGEEGYASLFYLAEDVYTTRKIYEFFAPKVSKDLYQWQADTNYSTLMLEITGMYVNHDVMGEIKPALIREQEKVVAKLRELVNDESYNPNSNAETAAVMQNLGITLETKTDSGAYSVAKGVLAEIEHPFVDTLTEYRETAKMLSTYVIPQSQEKYVFSTFKVDGTRTGRLSSANYNLQNIPNKLGYKKVFTSRFGDNGYIFLCDHAQAELRIAAYLSGDVVFAKALASGDAHSTVASLIFNKKVDKTTPEGKILREISKAVVFGLLYGGTAIGLAARLRASGFNVTDTDVQRAFDGFFATFKVLGEWLKGIKKQLHQVGKIESPLGQLYNYNYDIADGRMKNVEREGTNAPIQGVSSQVVGKILSTTQRELDARGLEALLTNTVHDSVGGDTPIDEVNEVVAAVNVAFESLTEFDFVKNSPVFPYLPLTGELVFGKSWFDCEGKEAGSKRISEHPMASHKVIK